MTKWDDKTADNSHTDDAIRGFTGEYRWLSNFWPCKVIYGSLVYKSSEAAYQAAKIEDEEQRKLFTTMSASESKKAGKTLYLRYDWDAVKQSVMAEILESKFRLNPELKQKLIATSGKYLEETNWWNDRYWGVCRGKGMNILGKLLMLLRDKLEDE